ncbi:MULTISPECIES: MMPL family transporter [Lactiplantibacillus]|uniref:MMPL family transporter n=1 Tax=Lactiplantibacillus pentosus TaxID=1589 RepID=A0AAW8WJY2_LACPE|nr:MMPL family transporter [Lactiplantibacillus pentosus]MBU7482976.1 MMPL family transporter [Lactiplantibacillus sp. 30.2.29]MBU7460451.1 MMPL family transporter [Lactiplantibacillus pentosus]MBU7476734.1 MMPL family transporter [Lactiplantibacillus pentosus]MBU7486444.1 MMPL family transporter [Lactiplantibacillus pentosus]MBU7499470.1 MMPL family transporter [Lactiplantibacillus pentosus]
MKGSRRRFTIQAIIWLVVMVAAIIFLPNISSLVRDKGQTKLPSSAKSQVAQVIQNHWGRNQNNTRQVVVVFNNGDSPLTADQKQAIDGTIKHFKDQKSKYHVKSMTAASDNAAAKKQLISKDKSTELLQLMVGKKQTVANMTKNITDGAKTAGVKTYVTGSDILNDDFTQETEAGIQKTEIITVIFIFIVLTLVFRSPITPLVSLLSVGVSFIISLSVVMNLVDKFNFPLSNFTQVFMVVVLFGIGTDYNILMFDQFKEELSHGDSPVAATGRALKIAGRTILYSGSSLLIGFSALGLANFSIYKSAVGVAIAVAILLLVLLTLNPFFMALLGPRLFWPTKKFAGGSTSKMWHGIAASSVRYPIIALVVVLGVSLPFILTYNNQLNYDTLAELNDSIPAKKGFKVVQDHFSKGTAEPSTLYIKTDHALNNEKDLKLIDSLTKQLQKVKGVKTVASVTQPGGSEVSQLYVNDQLGTVTSGMKSAGKGLTKIGSGLDSANSKLKSANMSDSAKSAKKLADGADEVSSGLNTLNGKTGTLASGASQLASGSSSLASGLVTYTNGVYTVNSGLNQLNSKTGTLASGVNQLASGASSVFGGTTSLSSGLDTLNGYKSKISSGTGTLTSGVSSLQSGASQLTAGLQKMQTSVNSSVSSATSTANTQKLAELKKGLTSLNEAMESLSSASSTSVPDISGITTTASTLSKNGEAVKTDATNLQNALSNLQNSASGVGSVSLSESDIQTIVAAVNKNGGTALTTQQTAALTAALKATGEQINQKVKSASSSMSSSISSTETSATQLQKDLTTMNETSSDLSDDLKELSSLSSELDKLSDLNQLATKSIEANNGSLEVIAKLQSAISGMQQIQSGLNGTNGLVDGSQQISSGLTQLQSGASSLASQLNTYTNGVSTAATGANKVNSGASQVSSGLTSLQGQIPTLTSAISALDSGTNQLVSNSSTLNSGASQLASGTSSLNSQVPTLVSGVSKLNSGASQVASGNEQMYTSIQSLVGQMKTLQDGLKTASDGTKTINKGVGSANSYLTGLKDSAAAKTYYVPKSTLKGKTYKSALKAYMSGNNHATKMTIVLNENPSSKSAMNKVTAIQKQAENSLKGTALDGATIAIGGQTSETNDTQSIASSDFIRTAAIMLVGILIALMVITRSVLQPFYILGTLLLAYIMSLSITRMLSSWFMGQDMLTWNTPFFGFIMLIALGVDYSIFLMMKYREFDNSAATPSTRIVRASAVIGAVVLSAALILSGTFAALMPSGVLTLIQVAMVVIIGLIILVFAIPTIIPSLIRLTYPLTDRMEDESDAEKQTKRNRH